MVRGILVIFKTNFRSIMEEKSILNAVHLNDGVNQIMQIKGDTCQHLFPTFHDEWIEVIKLYDFKGVLCSPCVTQTR